MSVESVSRQAIAAEARTLSRLCVETDTGHVNKEKLKEGRRAGPQINFPICWGPRMLETAGSEPLGRRCTTSRSIRLICLCSRGPASPRQSPPVPDDMPPRSNVRCEVGPATSGYAAPSQAPAAPRPTRGWTRPGCSVIGGCPAPDLSDARPCPEDPTKPLQRHLGPALATSCSWQPLA